MGTTINSPTRLYITKDAIPETIFHSNNVSIFMDVTEQKEHGKQGPAPQLASFVIG
jgi:hypothetical protein